MASMTDQSLLGDRKACVQALNHLKLGVSPWRGLNFLSVGMGPQKLFINQALQDAKDGEARTLVVEQGYGFGKTHLLRLARELADRIGMRVAHITHDPLRNVAFHKPMNVYAEIVTDLCREYPHASYTRLLEQLAPAYRYDHQTTFRTHLPQSLSEVGTLGGPRGHQGLLVLVDELESLTTEAMPNRRSREIAYEVLVRLMSRQTGPKGCVLLMAVTPGTLERFEADWEKMHYWRPTISSNGVRAPMSFPRADMTFIPGAQLTVGDALLLHSRIDAVHAVARNRPGMDSVSLSLVGIDLVRKCQHQDGTLHFRSFVQACVTDFDIRFQPGLDNDLSSPALPVTSPQSTLTPALANHAPLGPQPLAPIPHVTLAPRPAIPIPVVPGPGGTPATSPQPVVSNRQPAGTLTDRAVGGQPAVHPQTMGAERINIVPGALVRFQFPNINGWMAATIVSVDRAKRTARVRLERYQMEVTVDMDRLAARG